MSPEILLHDSTGNQAASNSTPDADQGTFEERSLADWLTTLSAVERVISSEGSVGSTACWLLDLYGVKAALLSPWHPLWAA